MNRTTLAILCLAIHSTLAPAFAVAQEASLKKPSFDSDGVPIHYIVSGREDGEAIVLIHGFADKMEPQWVPVITALKKDYKVIAMDCRGHGGSGKPHDPKKYGAEMVNDVARLLDHLKIDKAHVAGYSMGAGITLRFAVHHPQRVLTATMGGSSGTNHGKKDLILAVADSLETGGGIGPVILALTPKNRPKPTPEALKIIDNAVLSINDAKALAAVARGTADDSLSDKQIEGIRVPTLVLIGADDPMRDGVDELKKLLPGTRVTVIEKADHMTAWTRPEFVSELRRFLEENRQPAK